MRMRVVVSRVLLSKHDLDMSRSRLLIVAPENCNCQVARNHMATVVDDDLALHYHLGSIVVDVAAHGID